MPEISGLHITTPEAQELENKRAELSELESLIAEREWQLTNLRAELQAFERKYLAEVGVRYAELDELKAALAQRLAERNPEDARQREAARQARTRADETRATAGTDVSGAHKIFSATPELKRLYRDVARRIHPDLTSDPADRAKRQQLMAEANRAYETGDEAALARVFAAYECSPETVQGDGAGADLIRTIRRISQIKDRIGNIEREAHQLLRSDLYRLGVRFEEESKRGRDLFAEMTGRVAEKIAITKAALERAMGEAARR
jgi:hypothetical protein